MSLDDFLFLGRAPSAADIATLAASPFEPELSVWSAYQEGKKLYAASVRRAYGYKAGAHRGIAIIDLETGAKDYVLEDHVPIYFARRIGEELVFGSGQGLLKVREDSDPKLIPFASGVNEFGGGVNAMVHIAGDDYLIGSNRTLGIYNHASDSIREQELPHTLIFDIVTLARTSRGYAVGMDHQEGSTALIFLDEQLQLDRIIAFKAIYVQEIVYWQDFLLVLEHHKMTILDMKTNTSIGVGSEGGFTIVQNPADPAEFWLGSIPAGVKIIRCDLARRKWSIDAAKTQIVNHHIRSFGNGYVSCIHFLDGRVIIFQEQGGCLLTPGNGRRIHATTAAEIENLKPSKYDLSRASNEEERQTLDLINQVERNMVEKLRRESYSVSRAFQYDIAEDAPDEERLLAEALNEFFREHGIAFDPNGNMGLFRIMTIKTINPEKRAWFINLLSNFERIRANRKPTIRLLRLLGFGSPYQVGFEKVTRPEERCLIEKINRFMRDHRVTFDPMNMFARLRILMTQNINAQQAAEFLEMIDELKRLRSARMADANR